MSLQLPIKAAKGNGVTYIHQIITWNTVTANLPSENNLSEMAESKQKQAWKGFQPSSAIEGIRYFQNPRIFLRKCLEIFWIFLEIFGEFLEFFWIFFWKFFGRNFLGEIFWEDFFGRIFPRIFWEDYWEDFLGGILCLHWNWLVCQDFGVMQGTKEGSRIFNP